jgi:mannan endo-1,4-beta-mannosidase
MSRANAEPEVRWSGHRKPPPPKRRRRAAIISAAVAIGSLMVIGAAFLATGSIFGSQVQTQTIPYLGVYEPDAPNSYSGLAQVGHAIGRRPNLAVYYSHWLEPFQVAFATAAVNHGATTVVQIAPGNISLTSIAEGQYDTYLRSYAEAVKAFGAPVILSFGHEMNGDWYPWARNHASPAVFVQAWRHIVTVFRNTGSRNVTWMWTVNIMGTSTPDPGPWWPGQAYVNWVAIDGYFWLRASEFDAVFGGTIAFVRELTHDPILIGETGASPFENQPAKVSQLFSGVRTFGLLGFVWFDGNVASAAVPGEVLDWRLNKASLAVLRQDAKQYVEAQPSPSLAQSAKKG